MFLNVPWICFTQVGKTDMEIIVLREEVFMLTDPSLEAGGTAWHATEGHVGKHQGWSGGRMHEEKAWAQTFTVAFLGRTR